MADAKLSAEERQAMKEYMAEKKLAAKRAKTENEDAENLADVLAKIEAMAPADRAIAQGIHELIGKVAPTLKAKTWYGMQAYFLDGKIVCFFQDGGKFKSRYSTLGFQQDAALDDGEMWPTSFAVLELTPAVIDRISALLRQSIGAGEVKLAERAAKRASTLSKIGDTYGQVWPADHREQALAEWPE